MQIGLLGNWLRYLSFSDCKNIKISKLLILNVQLSSLRYPIDTEKAFGVPRWFTNGLLRRERNFHDFRARKFK